MVAQVTERLLAQEESMYRYCLWDGEGSGARTWEGPLGVEREQRPLAGKQMGTWVLQPQGTESCLNLNKRESGFSSLQVEAQPGWLPDFGFVRLRADSLIKSWTSDLQNNEQINSFVCFYSFNFLFWDHCKSMFCSRKQYREVHGPFT